MRLTTITVSYRKAVSDGNYGTEAAECSLTAEVDPDEDNEDGELEGVLFDQARHLVYEKLNESTSAQVRQALRTKS